MRNFFIADPHLGHANIIKYTDRPFKSQEEIDLLDMADRGVINAKEVKISQASVDRMDATIIDNINNVVEVNDVLWILGDFCFGNRRNFYQTAASYRKRINCRNVNLVIGNHDEKDVLYKVFSDGNYTTKFYDHLLTTIESQRIFLDHYPMRSWDNSHHGAWMLYGHVHGLFSDEDEGIMPWFHRKALTKSFLELFQSMGVEIVGDPKLPAESLVGKMLDMVAEEIYGNRLTLDVGVDRDHRFAPWSMDDLRTHFFKKMPKWLDRMERMREDVRPSSLKTKDADPTGLT